MATRSLALEKAKLMHERNEVVAELEHLREIIKAEVDLEPDEGDEQITEHETAAIVVALLEQKLLDIDAALSAIESGVYSLCERCGSHIEPERLMAKPDARYCLKCQEVVERVHARAYAKPVPDIATYFKEFTF